MSPRASLLGIPLDSVTSSQAITRIRELLHHPGQHHVMTPNAEMLVESVRNPAFRAVLQKSALNLPDSQSVVWFAKLPARVTGVDTVQALCAELDERHPVFLLGAQAGVADRAATVLRTKNPKLKIVGTFSGSPNEHDATDIIHRINHAGPHLLLVAFGAPTQDLWIDAHLSSLKTVRVAMGVGGTFDFLAGVQTRAPKWMRSMGLEWLWRFVQQPSRWRRMWRAVIVFPWFVLTRAGSAPR